MRARAYAFPCVFRLSLALALSRARSLTLSLALSRCVCECEGECVCVCVCVCRVRVCVAEVLLDGPRSVPTLECCGAARRRLPCSAAPSKQNVCLRIGYRGP
jgi:hypothetical protein